MSETPDTPASFMRKAERALASARVLLQDGDPEGACNRAYYAMFDAARAALMTLPEDVGPLATIKCLSQNSRCAAVLRREDDR